MSEQATKTQAPPSDDPLLGDLTAPQLEAVTHVDGPLLVLAGAGSGKTRVITRRIAYLVLRVGLAPWNVLAITFTNKAAGEMRDRIAALVSQRQARAVTVCTFHSLCARIIRQYADRLGLPSGYSIYDTADQKRVMKQALTALEISVGNFSPATVLATIGNAKNELIDAEAFALSAGGFYDRTVARIYTKYQQILTANKALDFDDLLLGTVRLFKDHADVLAELRQRFEYILIDEYQDTNRAQFIIADTLAAEHKNICATGDPDQSIYAWRGADIQNILDFESHYPNAAVVRLEQNYRSTKHILAVADSLIRHNTQRKAKALWTENDEGEPVDVIFCRDEHEEARCIVDQFRDLHDQHEMPWRDMAVFYRVNSLSRVMEDDLRNSGIPYQIARGTAFYDRKEIKDAVAYLRVIANPADGVNLLRIINLPARGISNATVKTLQAHAIANSMGIDQVIAAPGKLSNLNPRAVNAVEKFAEQLAEWRKDTESIEMSLRYFVEQVIRDSGLQSHYGNAKDDPDAERVMNLGELVSSAQQFEDEIAYDDEDNRAEQPLGRRLEAYLERISLVSDVDALDADHGAVTLMTLHAAKGLEFGAVAIIGVEDGLLPHERAGESLHQMEEERRLCFVGITRAMRRLFISHARYRTVFGQKMPTIPSRFLGELPKEHLHEEDRGDDLQAFEDDWFAESAEQRHDAVALAGEFPPGTLVQHDKFGLGRVLDISPAGTHTRARIEFQTAGIRTMVLQYANLEKADV